VLNKVSLLLVLAAAPLAAQSNGDSARSVTHGVYSEDQAERGKAAFGQYCASCHETSFHTGEQFRMGWFGRSVADLFKTLKTTMPEDNIGGLSDEEYTRVIAYILKLNGFPAGKDSLPADSAAMRKLRIGPAAGAR
jgi:S-disulfanyl-L-cysteine oxidoreductase SoxD